MKRTFITILLLSVIIIMSSGCKKKEEEAVLTINDIKLTKEDFLYDIYLVETEGNSKDEFYRENYGMSYWDTPYNEQGDTLRDMAKDTVISRVTMYEILNDRAGKAGISLTEEEIKENEKAFDKLVMEFGTEELAAAGLTRDIVLKAYNRITLGDKYYTELIKDFNIDTDRISQGINPEDYREYKTECLYAPTVVRQDQDIIPIGKDDLKKNYAALEDALENIWEGLDFNAIIEEDTEDILTKYTRSFILSDNIPEPEYRDAAIQLENGEYSEIVTTNYGYYIIHMLDNNASDRYEQAVEAAVMNEEYKHFEVLYEEWKAEYEITINSKYWDSFVIGSSPNQ
jgi:foldase protein PrsA